MLSFTPQIQLWLHVIFPDNRSHSSDLPHKAWIGVHCCSLRQLILAKSWLRCEPKRCLKENWFYVHVCLFLKVCVFFDLRGGEPFNSFCVAPMLLGKPSQQWKPTLLLGEFCSQMSCPWVAAFEINLQVPSANIPAWLWFCYLCPRCKTVHENDTARFCQSHPSTVFYSHSFLFPLSVLWASRNSFSSDTSFASSTCLYLHRLFAHL